MKRFAVLGFVDDDVVFQRHGLGAEAAADGAHRHRSAGRNQQSLSCHQASRAVSKVRPQHGADRFSRRHGGDAVADRRRYSIRHSGRRGDADGKSARREYLFRRRHDQHFPVPYSFPPRDQGAGGLARQEDRHQPLRLFVRYRGARRGGEVWTQARQGCDYSCRAAARASASRR